MTEIMSSPWHFAAWIVGAVAWTVILIALLALVAFVTWQAIVATAWVARGFWNVYVRGMTRNRNCTIAQAWRWGFWYEGLMRWMR
jgi:hypothetical protein